MSASLPDDCAWLLDLQRGLIARRQAVAVGIDSATVDALLRTGRWRPLYRGVYAAFTGEPPRESQLWAACLRAGPGAALSHHTAAELDGLTDRPSKVIHVTVGHDRRIGIPASEGYGHAPRVVIHRSGRIDDIRHPARTPPRTRVEETVLLRRRGRRARCAPPPRLERPCLAAAVRAAPSELTGSSFSHIY